jgi:hypothetical protein
LFSPNSLAEHVVLLVRRDGCSAALTYHETVSASTTDLVLTLTNGLPSAATFTITTNTATGMILEEKRSMRTLFYRQEKSYQDH